MSAESEQSIGIVLGEALRARREKSGLSLRAAALALRHKLPLADSIVYATARQSDAVVWTQDSDFENLPGVRFWPRT